MPRESVPATKRVTLLTSCKRRTELQRFFPWLVRTALLFLALAFGLPARADSSLLPQPALLPNFNPLCDSNLVPCLDIDRYALHVYAHLMVFPRTELRDTAATFPYGVTLGLFGRFAGGISTQSSFWQQNDGLQRAQGPLRLSFTALLWPLFPLSQAPLASRDHIGASYFVPPRRLRVGLSLDHEWRVGPFDGSNSLGTLTDLAALRLVAVKALGPVEITASLGALYDWRGTFAIGEAAAQIGLYLPFFKALKVYAEAQGRGAPRYVKNDLAWPLFGGLGLLHPQAVLGGGLSFRPSERVDLGVSVQRGFGGLAPVAVLVRFLTLSLGVTYEHRAATPVPQLAADAVVEVAAVIKEYLASLPIDPWLDKACLLWDDNGTLLAPQPVGARIEDGRQCMVQGELVPIGQKLWRDGKKSLICRDKKFTDCLMYRRPGGHDYRALHRPWVGGDCVLRERIYDPAAPGLAQGATHRVVQLAVLGRITDDKQGCRDDKGYVHAVGTQYYREHNHQWICAAPRIEEQRDRCFMALAELPGKMQNQTTQLGRVARALDHGAVEESRALDKLPDHLLRTAEGIQAGSINAGTVADAIQDRAFTFAHHLTWEGVKETWEGLKKFAKQPLIEQTEDGAHALGGAIAGAPVALGVGLATEGIGGALLSGTEKLAEVAKAGTTGKRVVEATTKAPKRLAAAEKKIAQEIEHTAAHAPTTKVGVDRHGNYTGPDNTVHPGGVLPGENSIPLDTGSSRNFRADQRRAVNQLGDTHGCVGCATTEPGTKPGRRPAGAGHTPDKGNFIIDHEPPVSQGGSGPYRGQPHCLTCSNRQGGSLSHAAKKSDP